MNRPDNNNKSKPNHKRKAKKRWHKPPIRFYYDQAGRRIIRKIGFYWVMKRTKGVRGLYHQGVECSVCGRIDSDGYLYPVNDTCYVALCTTCKRGMKNGPGLHIIYTPM